MVAGMRWLGKNNVLKINMILNLTMWFGLVWFGIMYDCYYYWKMKDESDRNAERRRNNETSQEVEKLPFKTCKPSSQNGVGRSCDYYIRLKFNYRLNLPTKRWLERSWTCSSSSVWFNRIKSCNHHFVFCSGLMMRTRSGLLKTKSPLAIQLWSLTLHIKEEEKKRLHQSCNNNNNNHRHHDVMVIFISFEQFMIECEVQ